MGLIEKSTVMQATGTPPKKIEEFVGRVNSATEILSIARMRSPKGWSESGQCPDFDEWTVVLSGRVRVETKTGAAVVSEGQTYHAPRGEWVRYSTPEEPAEYMAVCSPAFSPALVHREE
jgi:mannose-6-phosphate isomerase-like protein (cupin superfamily)